MLFRCGLAWRQHSSTYPSTTSCSSPILRYPAAVSSQNDCCARNMMVNHQSFVVAYFQTDPHDPMLSWRIDPNRPQIMRSSCHPPSLSGMWSEIPICGTSAEIVSRDLKLSKSHWSRQWGWAETNHCSSR